MPVSITSPPPRFFHRASASRWAFLLLACACVLRRWRSLAACFSPMALRLSSSACCSLVSPLVPLTPFITVSNAESLRAIVCPLDRCLSSLSQLTRARWSGSMSDLKGFFFFGPLAGGEPQNDRRAHSLPRLASAYTFPRGKGPSGEGPVPLLAVQVSDSGNRVVVLPGEVHQPVFIQLGSHAAFQFSADPVKNHADLLAGELANGFVVRHRQRLIVEAHQHVLGLSGSDVAHGGRLRDRSRWDGFGLAGGLVV